MFEKALIEKKLNLIVEYLDELSPTIEPFSIEEIMGDPMRLHASERLLQLIVDAMLDINVHFVKERKLGVPDDLQSTFRTLADGCILPRDFAEHIAPVVGLRNRIVHQYEKVSKRIFVESLKRNYPDFKEYITLISQHM